VSASVNNNSLIHFSETVSSTWPLKKEFSPRISSVDQIKFPSSHKAKTSVSVPNRSPECLTTLMPRLSSLRSNSSALQMVEKARFAKK
jgi:hypothetical protein